MASLTGSTIASSYEQLLSLPDGGLNGNTLVAITDGDSSTAIGMKVATSKIEVIPASDDANAFEVSKADGTAVLTVNTSTVGATLIGALTVGVDGTGHDVIFYGDSASSNMTWDEDGNTDGQLVLNDARIFIDQDENKQSLVIDSESTSYNSITITGKYGAHITQDISGGYGAEITRDIAESGSNGLVRIIDNNANNTQPALQVQQDGAGEGILIDQNGNHRAISIDSEATSYEVIKISAPTTSTGSVIGIDDANSLSSGSILKLATSSTSLATTVSGGMVEIMSTGNSSTNVNNLLFIKNDDASATGTIGMYVQQDSTGPAISATGGIVEQGGTLKENLLTNSGFGVWSNSTLADVTAVFVDDMADNGTGDWTNEGDELVFDTDHYELSTSGINQQTYKASVNFTVGKLYQVSIQVKNGSASGKTLQIMSYDGTTTFLSPTITTTGSFATHTFVFEAGATTTSGQTGIKSLENLGGDNIELKDFQSYEVTPSITATGAASSGPDGWLQDGSAAAGQVISRVQENPASKTFTKHGSYYAVKQVGASSGRSSIAWPQAYGLDDAHTERFSGRTVTFGAWVQADDASNANLFIGETNSFTASSSSSYHDGTDDTWQWLEVTRTISANPTGFYCGLMQNSTSKTVYMTQPILVFGSSIGEGNYNSPVSEIVKCEKPIAIFTNETVASDTDFNLESKSNGMIPKGTKALFMRGNQTPNAQGNYFGIVFEANWQFLTYHPTGNVTDWHSYINVEHSGTAPQIRLERNATITAIYMQANAVQLF